MSQKAGRTDQKGQLLPLSERMKADELIKRQAKMAYRQSISRAHGETRGIALHGFILRNQGFIGRFWWLLTGRVLVPTAMKA